MAGQCHLAKIKQHQAPAERLFQWVRLLCRSAYLWLVINLLLLSPCQ